MGEHEDAETLATLEILAMDKTGIVDPRLAICEACVTRTIPGELLTQLHAEVRSVVLLEVPEPDWADWVGAAVKSILPTSPLLIRTSSRYGRQRGIDPEKLISLIAKRGGVIVVLESGDVTSDIATIADIRFELKAPDLSVLREVARRTVVGSAARIKSAPDHISSLMLLASCFPHGGKVETTIKKLKRLSAPSKSKEVSVPDLVAIHGLDAARQWGLDLRADITAWKAGEVPFAALEAGAVLEGPPGTGKTMVARIIANACGLTFIPTSIAELFATSNGDLGGVIQRVHSVFKQARDSAPSLLFIDELDALPSRDTMDNRGRDWWTPVITDFLVQLDSNLSDRAGVVVVGATNRYQDLDPALVRSGRLSKHLRIEPPNTAALEKIFRHYLGGDLPDADLHALAQLTTGATGASVAEWVSAARRSARNAGRSLQVEDLWDAAIGTETRRWDELWRTAVHEAGHCIVGHAIGSTPTFVTIRQVGASGGHTRFADEKFATRADLEKVAIIMLAGRAAEERLIGDHSIGAGGRRGSDLHLATNLIAQGYASFGWGDKSTWRAEPDNALALLLSDSKLFAAVEADLDSHAKTARSLIEKHADDCQRLAELLISRLSMDQEDLRTFFAAKSPTSTEIK